MQSLESDGAATPYFPQFISLWNEAKRVLHGHKMIVSILLQAELNQLNSDTWNDSAFYHAASLREWVRLTSHSGNIDCLNSCLWDCAVK